MQQTNCAPEDVSWGELGGCLEAVDAGTTTVVDHAHVNVSPAHSEFSIESTGKKKGVMSESFSFQLQMPSRLLFRQGFVLCFATHLPCESRRFSRTWLLTEACWMIGYLSI